MFTHNVSTKVWFFRQETYATDQFLEKDSGDDNTTEHSPLSIFRSRALSSLIKPADVPNFREKRFVRASIRLTCSLERISQLLLDSLQMHRSLVILAWTKGAIWNTSDSPNSIVERWRNKRFERLELFRERFFHSKAFGMWYIRSDWWKLTNNSDVMNTTSHRV